MSCTTTKFVGQDQYLLRKVKVENDINAINTSKILDYIKQHPNSYVLSQWPVALYVYGLSGQDSTKWINKQLRFLGEPPVIYNAKEEKFSCSQIQQMLVNKGYMNAQVRSETKIRHQKISVTYYIEGKVPYSIDHYFLTLPDTTAASIVKQTASESIHTGERFDTEALDAERNRVSKELRNNGYYSFQKDILSYYADTTHLKNRVDLELAIKKQYLKNDTLLQQIFTQNHFGEVLLYLLKRNLHSGTVFDHGTEDFQVDTLDGIQLFYRPKHHYFRSNMLASKCYIPAGGLYSDQYIQKTYEAYNKLSAVENVNINILQNAETKKLDANIYLTKAKANAYDVELEGTNSDGDLGAGVNLNYRNKSIFKGAETLKIGVNGSYEVMSSDVYNASTQLGGSVGLQFPSILLPFTGTQYKRYNPGTTDITASINFQSRPEYERNLASASLKYNWNYKGFKFSFFIPDISYIYLPWVSDEFSDTYLQPSSSIRFSYQDLLIVRAGLNVSYSNFKNSKNLRNYYTVSAGVKSAGSLLYLIDELRGSTKNSDGQYEIFNIAYAQYVKGTLDYCYNIITSQQSRVVLHAALGASTPFGNADVLPYEERFYSGGANTVRGWSVRNLGPGTLQDTSSIDFMRQSGDISMCFNIETRFKLFWKLDGALFYDVGNIWTIKAYEDQKGGEFKWDEFYTQFGMSYGIGLRLDFNFFVIRLDGGTKLYDPGEDAGNKWRSMRSSDDFAVHLAIGYPF